MHQEGTQGGGLKQKLVLAEGKASAKARGQGAGSLQGAERLASWRKMGKNRRLGDWGERGQTSVDLISKEYQEGV